LEKTGHDSNLGFFFLLSSFFSWAIVVGRSKVIIGQCVAAEEGHG